MEQKEYDKFMRRVRQIHIRLKFKTLSITVLQKGRICLEIKSNCFLNKVKFEMEPHLNKWPKQVQDAFQTLGMGTGSPMVLKYLLNEWSDVFQKEGN